MADNFSLFFTKNWRHLSLFCLPFLLVACTLENGFETHLREAIELYSERKQHYAEETNGKTNKLFNLLTATETALLPLARYIDLRATTHNKRGIAIVTNDFVPMANNRGYGMPIKTVVPLDERTKSAAKTIIKTVTQANPSDFYAVASASYQALEQLDVLESESNVYLSMAKHIIESIGIAALHGLFYDCQSNNKTHRLTTDLLKLQISGLTLTNPLLFDSMANEIHQLGVGVLVNDLPTIPFIHEYEDFLSNDSTSLSECSVNE